MNGQKIYVPGDPKTTRYIEQLSIIAGLIDQPTKYWVTAQHWGWIIAELNAHRDEILMDPTRPAPWDTNPNRPFQFGQLLVINARTDDEEVVRLLNEEPARVMEFDAKRERLITRSIEEARALTPTT